MRSPIPLYLVMYAVGVSGVCLGIFGLSIGNHKRNKLIAAEKAAAEGIDVEEGDTNEKAEGAMGRNEQKASKSSTHLVESQNDDSRRLPTLTSRMEISKTAAARPASSGSPESPKFGRVQLMSDTITQTGMPSLRHVQGLGRDFASTDRTSGAPPSDRSLTGDATVGPPSPQSGPTSERDADHEVVQFI